MSVGAIGGGMAMGGGMASARPAAGAAPAAGGAPPAGATPTEAPDSGKAASELMAKGSQSAPPWESLAAMGDQAMGDAVQDMNSIDLLIMLMLMAAMTGSKDDEESSGSGAMGFLAGLSFASQLGQSSGSDLQCGVPEVTPNAGTGGAIDVSA